MVFEDRVQALFKDPNVFGPFLVPAALILVEETLTPRLFGLHRLLKGLLLLLLLLGLIFSASRGAWANLAVGLGVLLVVMALRRGGGRKVLLALVLALVAGVLVAGAVSLSGSGDFLSDRARVQSYDADRFGAQAAGLEPAQRYPFGVGPGQFELVAPISAHSTYVRVFAEQGLPGILAFLTLVLFTLGAAVANAVAGRDTYGIGSAALLGAWCGLLVNSFVIDTLHWRHLWVVAALIWAGWMRRRLGSARRSAPLYRRQERTWRPNESEVIVKATASVLASALGFLAPALPGVDLTAEAVAAPCTISGSARADVLVGTPGE